MVIALRPEPRKVLIAGDWHGVASDATRIIRTAANAGAHWIVQLGDFGLWQYPESPYLDTLQTVCEETNVRLAWIDGNHEHHGLIKNITPNSKPRLHAVAVRPRIYYLPRGFRWTWQGRRWLAVGGGTSLDRERRLEGVDWWPTEEISLLTITEVAAGGLTDVMITHDGPASTTPRFDPYMIWPPGALDRARHHQQRVQRLMDLVQPTLHMHGHYHLSYTQRVNRVWGSALVIGLDHAGGRADHMLILDPFDLTWQRVR